MIHFHWINSYIFQYMTVIIRCVFKQNGIFYPQVYLGEFLYQM